MPAQLASGLALGYGVQGAQQLAPTLVLEYAAPGGATLRASVQIKAPWVAAALVKSSTAVVYGRATINDQSVDAPWLAGIPLDRSDSAPWGVAVKQDDQKTAPWGGPMVIQDADTLVAWVLSAARDDFKTAPWGGPMEVSDLLSAATWLLSAARDDFKTAPWGGPMLHAELLSGSRWPASAPADALRKVPWTQYSQQLHSDWSVIVPPGDEGTDALVVIPIQRVYIVVNSVTLMRVDGSVVIPTLNMSMSLDVDSWTWSASATVPGRALEDVMPNTNGDPVEVEAVVNSVAYRFLVESVSRDRSFNQSAIKLGMRGKTALLDSPYAPVMSFGNVDARTMAQLAGDVLTINGVPMGWTLNWTPEAWSVPAGVFQHQGTYISALNELVGAAGAYILPHRTLQEMTVLPRYPTAPWEWGSATPDYELPSAVTLQEGIEWVNRPQYNRVFVSGTGQGVLGQVTRTGTAGDLVAPMITNALITDVIGARLRGLPVLADTGRVANVSLKLPVLASTGIIVPGKMVRYTDGADTRIGITRAVSVSVGSSAVDLRQTIAVETQE